MLRITIGITVIAMTLWSMRWVIGGRAIEIVDPIVREWAAAEVDRLSDGSYQLALSPIRVSAAEQLIAIDSITLSTDSSANILRDAPLPFIAMKLYSCTINAVDLERLARRRGFAADRAGCDSVSTTITVPEGVALDSSESGQFLALKEDLDLARGIPFIDVDSLVFPHVQMSLAIAPGSGRSTALAFDHLEIRLDNFHYDPDDKPTERRTLFSRNVTLRVDSLETTREGTDKVKLDRLRADLADGKLMLTGLRWNPVVGALTDSLGVDQLSVDSLDIAGVRWRDFLIRGDARVRRVHLSGAQLTMARHSQSAGSGREAEDNQAPSWTLARSLRAINRAISLDSLTARAVGLYQVSERDTLVTRMAAMALRNLHADPYGDGLSGSNPIGPLVLDLAEVSRTSSDLLLSVASVHLDLKAGVASADSFNFAPIGSDADFVRRHRRRTDRVSVQFDSLRIAGLDPGEWVRSGGYRANSLRIIGMDIDVLSDKRLPAGRPTRHRFPQQWIREVAPALAIKAISLQGRSQYRERDKDSPKPGVLRFEHLAMMISNLSSVGMPGSERPTEFVVTAQLMGAASFVLQGSIPLSANAFDMSYSGRLGPMRAESLNPFLDGALGVRFTDGQVHGIVFTAEAKDGLARGRVIPRYTNLWVEVPGVARSGFLSGIRRSIAKFAANQFAIRADNAAGQKETPVNGAIRHRWTPFETLLQFIWNGVRDGLVAVVKD